MYAMRGQQSPWWIGGLGNRVCPNFLCKHTLKKNTLDVKKCEANKKQPYLFVTESFDIS